MLKGEKSKGENNKNNFEQLLEWCTYNVSHQITHAKS